MPLRSYLIQRDGKGKAEKKAFFKELHAKPFIKPFLSQTCR